MVAWLAAIGLARLPPASAAESAARPATEASPVRDSAAATVHLDYRRDPAAASCVSAEQLMHAVEARLGRGVFVAADRAELVARVRSRRVGRRFVVEMELFDRGQHGLGRRELTTRAAHCSALDDSLALVLALAADMPREEPAASTPPSTVREPSPAGSAEAERARSLDTPISIPSATYAPRLGLALRPSLGPTAAVGLIPSLALGLELGIELRFPRFWPVTLHASGFGERRQAAAVASKGARFTAQTLVLGVCPWGGELGGLEASVCVAQRVGRVRARGVGFDEEQRDDGWALSAGASVGLSRTLGPVFVAASGSLLVPVARRRYFFTDDVDTTLYEQPWLGGLAALRVGTEI